jgi:hypothetical protein
VDLYFSRRLETYQGPSGRTVVKHRMDLTNLRKSTEDALQPHVVKNDVLIVKGWTEIIEQSRDVEHPYIEIHIWLPEETK